MSLSKGIEYHGSQSRLLCSSGHREYIRCQRHHITESMYIHERTEWARTYSVLGPQVVFSKSFVGNAVSQVFCLHLLQLASYSMAKVFAERGYSFGNIDVSSS